MGGKGGMRLRNRIAISVPFVLLVAAALFPFAPGTAMCTEISNTASRPAIILAWDNSGDFGPATPGTRTAGWQEALDACVEQKRDLYVKGGWGGRDAVYHVSETIRIPPTQDFHIDGGVYVVNWTGPADRDLLVVDSGMDCHFSFGILVYGGNGAALRVRPEHPVPIDNFAAFVDSDIRVSSIADPRPFERGRREGGAGVVFDTEKASITHADFSFTAVLNFATCIVAPDAGRGFTLNSVSCAHLHTNADSSTLLDIGRQSRQNVFDMRIGVDQGAADVTGVRVRGRNNELRVNTRGGFSDGRHVVFEESASGNQLNLSHRDTVFIPEKFLTDRAVTPTNQVTWAGAPPPIREIDGTAGEFVYVQRLFPAVLRIVGGNVSSVVLVRGDDHVSYPPATERELVLSVGDTVRITSTAPPRLTIIPVKMR